MLRYIIGDPTVTEEKWLEPCAGDGAIIQAVCEYLWNHTRFHPPIFDSIEIRKDAKSFSTPDLTHYPERDAIKDPLNGRYHCLITNPPFDTWTDFLLTYWGQCDHILLLLPLNYLGSKKRANIWREWPISGLYPIFDRPSFTGDGKTDTEYYAWYHWQPGSAKSQTINFQVI